MRPVAPARSSIFMLALVAALAIGFAVGLATIKAAGSHGNGFLMASAGVMNWQHQFDPRRRLNILVMGIDDNWTNRDEFYTRGARSDTIFVVSLDLDTNKASLLSIPRDSRVQIADTDHWGKINGAYATGGVPRALATVANFLDVPLDYYVVLKIDATKKLVDSIGGVDLDVEHDMSYDDNWGHLHIHLKKGMQQLDGNQAVGYIRFRHDREGDFGRLRRQQQLLHVIVQKLKTPAMLPHTNDLITTFRQAVDTNLTDADLGALAYRFKNALNPADLTTAYVPGADGKVGGVWYLIPDEEKKRRLVQWLLKGNQESEVALVHVTVYNGCGSPAAAQQVEQRLRQSGFQAADGGDADRSDYASTQVLDYDRYHGAGELVASHLGTSLGPLVQPDPHAASDVDVIVGHDAASNTLASRATP